MLDDSGLIYDEEAKTYRPLFQAVVADSSTLSRSPPPIPHNNWISRNHK
jgi:hypothetical protein